MTRAISAVLLAALCAGCAGVSKLDFGAFGSRAAWQRPDDVLRVLAIEPGDHVVDLGSGGGYFLPALSRAVGPGGKVYAVDVDPNVTLDLSALVEEQGLANVEVVLGDYDDPRVPDGSVDLVLLVNAYHHIEKRPVYFESLKADLDPAGRVAVIEPDAELGGVLGLFVEDEHATRRLALRDEMARAGYAATASYDFLPVQIFEIFTLGERAAPGLAAGR